jgi:type I restriction enzyme S subunit
MAGEVRETIYGDFAADFIVDRLVNLCDPDAGIQTGPFGSQLHQEDYVAVGTPIITVEHLGENRILHEGVPRVSDADRDRLSRYSLRMGDIVFSRVGSVDRRSLVRRAEDGWLFSGRCLRVRPNANRIDSGFLSYFFGLSAFKEHIRAIAVGATMPSLNTSILSDVVVPHPRDISEQRAIAHILGTLDDKIELNRRMNETLEAMARALFKSWFVDFDPVRAKAEGRWKHGQSLPGLPANLYDLFPDRFVDSELGEIPAGWEVKTIGDLAEVVGGSTPSTSRLEFWESGCHCWATPKDLAALTSPVLLNTERRVTDAGLAQIGSGLLPIGTVLLSSRAPIGYLAIAETPVAINQGFIAMKPKGEVTSPFLLLWTRFAHEEILSRANGSTFLEISKSNFRPIPAARPKEPVFRAFDSLVTPLYRRLVSNVRESRTLAAIRDMLLPELISGELRVKDAERFLEETP